MSELGNKEIMAKNIKKFMDERGIDRNKLSSELDLSYTTISDWINAKTYPRIDKIEMLANYFNVKKSDLVEDKKGKILDITPIYNQLDENRQKKVYDFAEKQLKEQQNKVIDLREYRDVKVQSVLSAGTGIVDLEPQYTEIISYKGFIPSKYDLAFKVSGDSMEPLFEDGEIVFVEVDSDVRNGQIGVVLIDDEAYIKKMYVEQGQIRLVSLNKKYEDIIACENIKVVGRVIL